MKILSILSRLFLCGQTLENELEPHVGFDEAGAPGFPFVRQAFGLYLLQGFAGGDLLTDDVGRFDQHAVVGL